MSDHTPGPWQTIRHGDPFCWEIDNGERCVSQGVWHEADAHLMSAAPELLAELEKCETLLGELCDGGGLDGHPDYKLWMSVRGVIAKAKGGDA